MDGWRDCVCYHMKMKSIAFLSAVILLTSGSAASERRLSVEDYRDRMEAGWIGQIAGVGVGGPTEFKFCHKLVPDEKIRPWSPEMVNEAFHQDDLYVEMTFLATLERYGLGVDIRRAGIEFANSRYRLWHANAEGRNALRAGIAPPDSSHPSVNVCANDIDYQIEADYSGLVAPGCFQGVVALGEKFGRLMNYGDGLWAGQFVGAMYAAAFFERDPRRIVEAALRVIPAQSRYAEMVRDLLAWHKADGADWEDAWRKVIAKYGHEGGCLVQPHVIEATLNGAMVVLGVLYGNGDPYRTIVISTRGGFDSDCNPSSAAGVIFTSIGKRDLAHTWYEKLDRQAVFEYTAYTYPALVAVCEKIAREVVAAEGGRVERDEAGKEWFVVPERPVKPSPFATFAKPDPLTGSRFTAEEMAEIRYLPMSVGKRGYWDRWGVDSKEKPRSDGLDVPPSFAGHPFEKQLDELYAEIVSQIADGRPLPNKYVYSRPWHRDAAMVAMVLERCGRIGLIRDWILSVDDPFDRNNKGEEEPDNLGETLYMLGCVTNATHPAVTKIAGIARSRTDADGFLVGRVDYGRHRVYAAKWLKLGLEKCGLDSSWVKIPQEKDDYDDLFWMDGSRKAELADAVLDQNYPYLTWAAWHKAGRRFRPDDVPVNAGTMSWEAHASEANYEGLRTICGEWADRKIAYPHTWHAAEMFLLLWDCRARPE